MNRLQAAAARSTQQRQYFEGMAAHYEELAADIEAGREVDGEDGGD